MDYTFEETPVKNTQSTHTLWVEKYRPQGLDRYIGNDQLKETVDSFLKRNDVPHLMFYGKPGTGKTTLAKLISKNINCDVMYINASDENSVENVRNKIKSFASSTGFKPLKIIILDECDYMSPEAQAALRNLMETFSLTTRFILTCNYHEKMIPPIISRCQTYEINPMSKSQIGIYLTDVLKCENVKYTMEDLAYIIKTYHPDIRKILNFTQQNVIDGNLKIAKDNVVELDFHEKLITMLKNGIGKSSVFNEIRQLVADSEVSQFDECFHLLYSRVDEYAPGKQAVATIVIAEYMYQCSLLVGALKEIAFMACISKLMNDLKK